MVETPGSPITPRIREPREGDAEAIARLHVATWAEAYADQLPAEFFSESAIESRLRMWRAVLAQPDEGRRVVLAESGDQLAGFAWSGLPEDPVDRPRPRQLYAIYLFAARYGSGLGQRMLDAVVGEEPAFLWVAERNPRARAFYTRNGFVLDGAQKVEPDAPGFVTLRMVR